MNNKYVTYFEVIYGTEIACYACKDPDTYATKLKKLAAEHEDLELMYREWSDGSAENGVIEKEDWNIG